MTSEDWKRLGDGLNKGGNGVMLSVLWLIIFLVVSVPALFIIAAGLFH